MTYLKSINNKSNMYGEYYIKMYQREKEYER